MIFIVFRDRASLEVAGYAKMTFSKRFDAIVPFIVDY